MKNTEFRVKRSLLHAGTECDRAPCNQAQAMLSTGATKRRSLMHKAAKAR
ncbi:hypothetical protein [Scytonema sp. HK-05]|nr:hypothetical protein [Scytonema sp. HK-05]